MTDHPRSEHFACPAERVLYPDEWASEDGRVGWVSREQVSDAEDAIALVRQDADLLDEGLPLRAVPVLMREESEVEAKINGHEFPLWVECTKRARSHRPYWRVELAEEDC